MNNSWYLFGIQIYILKDLIVDPVMSRLDYLSVNITIQELCSFMYTFHNIGFSIFYLITFKTSNIIS